jgi:uncharacterized membrane protein
MTDPAPNAPAPAPRTGRGLRWLLVVSLALNLLFLGLAAGGAARMWRGGPIGQTAPAAELQLLWRALPEDDRRAMRQDDSAYRSQAMQGGGVSDGHVSRSDREEVRSRLAGDVVALRTLLLAEPFDRAALEARLMQVRNLQAQRADRALARMLDRIEAMGPAERARMVERLDRRAAREGRYGDRSGRDDDRREERREDRRDDRRD